MSCSQERVIPAIEIGLPLKSSGVLYVLAVGLQMAPGRGDEHEQQAQGDRQPDARGRPVQRAHDDPFDDDAEHRGRHEQDEGERHAARAVPIPATAARTGRPCTMPMAPWAKLKMPVVL